MPPPSMTPALIFVVAAVLAVYRCPAGDENAPKEDEIKDGLTRRRKLGTKVPREDIE